MEYAKKLEKTHEITNITAHKKNNTHEGLVDKRKNEFNFKEIMNSKVISMKDKSDPKKTVTETYMFRYSAVYSLIYISSVILILYVFIMLRDFVQNHLNEQLTNTLNTILK